MTNDIRKFTFLCIEIATSKLINVIIDGILDGIFTGHGVTEEK